MYVIKRHNTVVIGGTVGCATLTEALDEIPCYEGENGITVEDREEYYDVVELETGKIQSFSECEQILNAERRA